MLGGEATGLGLLALAAWAGWLTLFGLLLVATRARRPDPAGPSMDFPGDEPPALVNFLTNGWACSRDAVPATLLDLAARQHVRIDHVPGGDFVVKLDPDLKGDGKELTDYERQVLNHVRSLAVNGEVPGDALTTGPADASKAWWRRFKDAVVLDARRRGLTRARWAPGMVLALIALSVPAAALGAAWVLRISEDPRPFIPDGIWLTLLLVGFVCVPLGFVRDQRDTPEGLQAASRWLGLRRYLDAEGSFAEQPPAGVAIWERYLSYGAAMGVADGALRQMPMGAESPYHAWSAYGGEWHVVRVHYPRLWPPGWGQKPWVATLLGFIGFSFATFFMLFLGWPLGRVLLEAVGTDEFALPIRLAFLLGGLLPILGVGTAMVYFGLMFVFGVMDAGREKELVGLVVRTKDVYSTNNNNRRLVKRYIAVDDGESRVVRAILGPISMVGFIECGEVARLKVSPSLGYVWSSAVLPKPKPKPEPDEPAETEPAEPAQ